MPGPTPKSTTYQYKSNDDPTKVAQQFGLTPNQLLGANQGGYPFSVGQTIKVPQYNSPIGPVQPTQFGPPKPPGNFGLTPSQAQNIPTTTGTNMSQRGQNAWTQRMNTQTAAVINNQFANGIAAPMVPGNAQVTNPITGAPMTPDDYVASGYTFNPKTNSWNLGGAVQNPGSGNQPVAGGSSSAFMNTGFMQQYAAQGTAFENQKRWDETTGKFVRIGDLIRQGKLDLKTGKNIPQKKNKGGGGGGGGQLATTPVTVQEPKQNANINSVLSFNLGSG